MRVFTTVPTVVESMVWEALAGAGWVGEMATFRMTVALRVGVPSAPATGATVHSGRGPPGRAGRIGETGRINACGVVWQQRVGPLNGRAAGPGYLLLESERRPDDCAFAEAMLFTAAVEAGWLTAATDGLVEVPDVRVVVGVARRNPRWEAFASGTADSGPAPPSAAPTASAVDERQLVALAHEVATRCGDSSPELIQYARGSRFDVTRTTGSVVFSNAPSYIVVMKGNFRSRRARGAGAEPSHEQSVSYYPFQTVVVDSETGEITDSGSSHQPPDLAPLGAIVTATGPAD